jgi:hypothetical protein
VCAASFPPHFVHLSWSSLQHRTRALPRMWLV